MLEQQGPWCWGITNQEWEPGDMKLTLKTRSYINRGLLVQAMKFGFTREYFQISCSCTTSNI